MSTGANPGSGKASDQRSRDQAANRRLRLPKASDVLANELRARILENDLAPGSPLPSEGDLIVEHNLSRGTVREALRLLEAEGFVSIQRGPKGGITVRYPDAQLVSRSLATLLTVDQTPLRNLFEFRKLVEPAAAASAAREATDEQRAELLALTEPSSPRRGHAQFHAVLGECIQNELMRVILAALFRVVDWHAGLENVSETDVERAGRAHERIAAAVAARDADAARERMLTHLAAFEDVMREQGRLDEPILPRARWVGYLRQHVQSV